MVWWVVPAYAGATMYVQGSSLNLRSAPSADAAVVDKLSINTAVEVTSSQGEFAKVKTADDEVGWVAAEFLAPQELTVAAALDRAAAAKDPAERLSWAQRAAAVDPTPEALAALEAAYRDAEDDAGAEIVAKERRWPRGLMLIAADRPVPVVELGPEDDVPADGLAVSRATLQRRFRTSPNLEGWLLLDQGAAVKTVLGGARKVQLGCGRAGATVAFVGWALPPGRTAIAFSAKPPASWSTDLRGSPIPEDQATAAADAGLAKLGGEGGQSWHVPTADGWFVRYAARSGGATTVVDALVTGSGVHEVARSQVDGEPARPLAVRDVNGDGQPDVLWADGCRRILATVDGPELARGLERCCPKG